MYVVIQVAKKDRAKAWGILVRHSPGTALPNHTFIISDEALKALRDAGVKLKEISRVSDLSPHAGAVNGERI
jgi:hypothetical protein